MDKIQKLQRALATLLVGMMAAGCAREKPLTHNPSQLFQRGKELWIILIAEDMPIEGSELASLWPEKGKYESSTSFFVKLTEQGSLDFAYTFFAGSGLTAATGATLLAENNAWCMKAGITSDFKSYAPVLFTRNLHFMVEDGTVTAKLRNDQLRLGKNAILLTYGGTARIMNTSQLADYAKQLKPSDVQDVLRP